MLANEPQVEPNLVTMQVMVMVGMRLKHAHYPVPYWSFKQSNTHRRSGWFGGG